MAGSFVVESEEDNIVVVVVVFAVESWNLLGSDDVWNDVFILGVV